MGPIRDDSGFSGRTIQSCPGISALKDRSESASRKQLKPDLRGQPSCATQESSAPCETLGPAGAIVSFRGFRRGLSLEHSADHVRRSQLARLRVPTNETRTPLACDCAPVLIRPRTDFPCPTSDPFFSAANHGAAMTMAGLDRTPLEILP